ncbi:MAG: cytochrome c [Actinomycetota bacterium]|nr:cytochrome c [Actinomycetota bacterium]
MTDRHISFSARIAISILTMLTMVMMATPAFAADIAIAVGAPERVSIGQDVEVKAVLSEDGVPVEGAEVALTYQASLAGESARVEIAWGTTDATGTAVMIYEQRADDNGEMQVVYLGPGADPVQPYVFTIAVESGGPQLYQIEAGVTIPFINGTLVITVISTVWFLIALAAIYLVRVGRAGRLASEAPTTEDGSMWISTALATAAVITAIGMVIVFVRSPVSNTHIKDPHSYDRTPIAYVGVDFSYVGFGLDDESAAQTGDPIADGSVLYFKYGCAACHGLSGQGAVVGTPLVDEIGSFGSFSEDIREGPKGMPGYDDATISEENLQRIHAYLKDGD